MALMKKKKDKPAAPAVAGEDKAAPKKNSKLLTIVGPLLIFGATFGATWITSKPAPPPISDPTVETPTAATHSADWTPQKPDNTLAMDPMTITAGTRGQTLRVGIAIEVWGEGDEIDDIRLRDAFTTYLRALDPSQLADPSFHMRMKRALLHRARVVAGPDVIADVLITDFLLTS